mgnify:CR=1 FL=1
MTVNITHFAGLSLEENVKNNFKQADMEAALAHILQTRYNAITLAKRFGCDPEQAASAALLHDLGRLVPAHEYLDLAETFNLEILPEEKQFPDLLHQKLSRVIAVETFNITDKEVLNAVACHTTLRPNAARLDKILFLADKLAAVPGKQPLCLWSSNSWKNLLMMPCTATCSTTCKTAKCRLCIPGSGLLLKN